MKASPILDAYEPQCPSGHHLPCGFQSLYVKLSFFLSLTILFIMSISAVPGLSPNALMSRGSKALQSSRACVTWALLSTAFTKNKERYRYVSKYYNALDKSLVHIDDPKRSTSAFGRQRGCHKTCKTVSVEHTPLVFGHATNIPVKPWSRVRRDIYILNLGVYLSLCSRHTKLWVH